MSDSPSLDDQISAAYFVAWHKLPDDGALTYWRNAINTDSAGVWSDYWEKRVEGWEAGGADIPPFGPYGYGADDPTIPDANINGANPLDAIQQFMMSRLPIGERWPEGLRAQVADAVVRVANFSLKTSASVPTSRKGSGGGGGGVVVQNNIDLTLDDL